ncbi:hypothetical protein K1W54_12345 [Micromonospora sp. CPCC 205371]|nr:hypothetical protein [Micromonospora sp. CPCC 205371]
MTADVPPLPASLADLVGVRERALDEHMYRLPQAGVPVTFRLQLFTAPGLRPVAIATQVPGAGDGTSLSNAAETCAETVWQQYFPNDPEPRRRHLSVVTFTANPVEQALHAPQWQHVLPAAVDALVGPPVDLERGSGFTPPEVKPFPESAYVARLVVLLPRPAPFRESGCMATGVPWWRRLGRQLAPRRGGRDCCWYHGGDWHTVARLAIRLAAQARAAGVGFDDTPSYVVDHPDAGPHRVGAGGAVLAHGRHDSPIRALATPQGLQQRPAPGPGTDRRRRALHAHRTRPRLNTPSPPQAGNSQ